MKVVGGWKKVTCNVDELHQKLDLLESSSEKYRYTTKKNTNEKYQQCTERKYFGFTTF